MGVHTKLDALYERVPRIACKGLCTADCADISMSLVEARRLWKKTGVWPVYDVEKKQCGYLEEGRCSVYRLRPLICRAFGVHEEMPCPFGCIPERSMTAQEYDRLYEMRADITGPERYNAQRKEA